MGSNSSIAFSEIMVFCIFDILMLFICLRFVTKLITIIYVIEQSLLCIYARILL